MIPTRLLAWATLAWNVAVILLGALVRATGSGAGCGRSWPSCQGELVPALEGATAIEFTHRAASGIALLLVAWLVVRVFRANPKGSQIRKSAAWSGVAIVGEALIGAAIVLYEWVEADDSVARAVAVPLHLVNTLILLGALTLTIFWVDRVGVVERQSPARRPLYAFGAGMLVIAATGAIAALAGTLFPAESLAEGIRQDLSDTAHFLTELRILHPVAAILVGLAAARWALRNAMDRSGTAARVVVGVVFVELVVGVLNVVTLTPIAISLVHLLLADVLWIAWVWMGAEMMTRSVNVPALAE